MSLRIQFVIFLQRVESLMQAIWQDHHLPEVWYLEEGRAQWGISMCISDEKIRLPDLLLSSLLGEKEYRSTLLAKDAAGWFWSPGVWPTAVQSALSSQGTWSWRSYLHSKFYPNYLNLSYYKIFYHITNETCIFSVKSKQITYYWYLNKYFIFWYLFI